MPKSLLLDLLPADIVTSVEALGFPAYRGRQVLNHVYKRHCDSFQEMSDVPVNLRTHLDDHYTLRAGSVVGDLISEDGQTRKILLRLEDGEIIETVLMRYDPRSDSRERATVCVSSQAGCAMGCGFCATGQQGFRRNLSSGEIVGQVLHFARALHEEGKRLTNIVFMGMGEPLANYGSLIKAIDTIVSPEGLGLGARHITVSTVGIVRGIRDLAREPYQVNLAVSLHAPDDELRQRLIATAYRYPLTEIIDASREFIAITGRRVSFEYALIEGQNDEPEQAGRLATMLRGMNCHVNLIPLNPTDGGITRRPSRARTLAFQRTLEGRGIPCTVRVEKGVEIAAACGQLRGAHERGDAVPVPLAT